MFKQTAKQTASVRPIPKQRASAAETIVSLEHVSKYFGKLAAVSELSLSILQGELFTLLGSSGCGKTTVLRMISGLEVADAGEIRIGEKRVNELPPFKRSVNTVFQGYALFPHMTVFENIAYGLVIKRFSSIAIKQKVNTMLERIGLSDKAGSLPRQLSGGQMQRVALARALVNEPDVLLLDEPLSALDAKLRGAMQIELKHIQQASGRTFINVTHDQEEALVLSDRIAVMRNGRIAQLGTPAEVFERPNSIFVADFLGVSNFIPAKVHRQNGESVSLIDQEGLAWEGRSRSSLAPRQLATIAIRPQKVRVLHTGFEPTATNQIDTQFVEFAYLGTSVRIVVRLHSGRTLQLDASPESLPIPYQGLRPGDRLRIEYQPGDVLIYPAEK
ncbi:ABC transporter ATP-binding protein [Mesorhizobium sp.]|uniref:ABC transporter ATP-binding protein n=1 Tax=Mesorhizobium sp. TaxID=1871066 RepID=UPI00257C6352|nr:ABC transporter ATP-binding protein [Mesorhizobium sp.]